MERRVPECFPVHSGPRDSAAARPEALLARRRTDVITAALLPAAVLSSAADLSALNEYAWAFRMTDPLQSASLGRDALALAESRQDAHGVVAALRTLALHDLYGGDLRSALYRLNRALELLGEDQNLALERICKSLLGSVYQELGNSDRATALHLEALELSKTLGHPDGEANALLNLGAVAWVGLGDPDLAAGYIRRALDIQRRTGNVHAQVMSLHNLAEVSIAKGMWQEARAYAQETRAVAQTCGIPMVEAQAVDNVAQSYAGTGEAERAAGLHDEALAMLLALNLDHRAVQADLQLHRARNLITLERFAEAESALHETLSLLSQIESQDQAVLVHRALSELYRRTGRFEQALFHSETSFALKEANERVQTGRRTQAMMMQFDVERAQSETESYRLRTVELAGVNSRLEQAARERAAMLATLQEQQEALLRQAQTDALSGLANRRHAETLLTQAFVGHAETGETFTVAMIDIDHFKRVNDDFSHAVGDEVIRQVGALLRGHLRAGDMVGRYGGEEFVMLLAGTDLDGARTALERLRVNVQAHPWERVAPGLKVTASLGAALSTAHANWEQVVHAADMQLYEAKRTRNAVVC